MYSLYTIDILKALASEDRTLADYIFSHITQGQDGLTKIMDRLGIASRSEKDAKKRLKAGWPPTTGYRMMLGLDGEAYAVDNFGRTFNLRTGVEIFHDVGFADQVLEGTGIGPQGEVIHFFPEQQMKILKGNTNQLM